MMNKRKMAISLTGILTVTAATSMETPAVANNQDYREKVIGVAGIMSIGANMDQPVTRGEFANMMVRASAYRDFLPVTSSTSVYADVSKDHAYASSIRIAVEQMWMTGYLGGMFRPDQPVTYQESMGGFLALLGYTSDDFGGDTMGARTSKFYALELNSQVDLQTREILTRRDCVNLFYNLLKTETKTTGKAYAIQLGCELNADGEVNPMGLADSSLKGPKVIPKGRNAGDYVPFSIQEASIFVGGEASSYESLKSILASNYVVIYYNTAAKTLWVYVADEDVQSGRCVVRGTVENIYYSSADVMTPTAVTLDGDGVEYKLNNSQVQFAFSIYGSLRVGDRVTLICEKTTNTNGDETYTVVDYVED